MPSYRRITVISRRLTNCTKLFFISLACFWIIGRAFIIMCRWSEEPAFGTCSGIIDHMCAEYSRNRLSGNMCLELCQNISSDRFHCKHISGDGKKVIFFARDANTKLVLKTKSFKSAELTPEHQELLKDTMTHESLATSLLFLRKISSYHFKTNATLNRFISYVDLDKNNNVAAVASAESLLQQEEYVAINNLQSSGIVPRLHGTCGSFYAVDYVPTDETLLVNTFTAGWPWTSVGQWEQRRTVAISLLELVERLDKQNRMLCDVKGENFAWLGEGKAGLLDVDTLFTKDELAGILKHDLCRKDSDCSFWDCHGSCNRSTRHCNAEISNTNFHAMCVKIFRHHVSNGLHGLLEDVPPKQQQLLQSRLSLCSSWKMSARESKFALSEIRKLLLHDQILG